ncbi:PAS domain-containing sensor histidine kinase [Streptomyces sp. S.PB5]|uniref:PAS domain-containing sensor histidine kinase n=1 Tax=Streptomyces sp. S.PB5 TaxID=3020844 RepID=UPI0025B17B92|nr:PAS domain-containing sensor histidine kinase [Streptomyces sp. S.PB5]MDN3029215.1 PAS domain-containing sensor histidine kinase [Streptomyces sp. S.PB5]
MEDVDSPRTTEGTAGPTEQQAELERRARLVDELSQELDDTNRGLIALHTELETARRAEARLAAIVASSDDAMISVSPALAVQTWNPGAQRLFGHHQEHVLDQGIGLLMPEAAFDVFRTVAEQIRAHGHADSYQSRWRRADGSEVDVAVTVSPMRDPEGTLIGFATVARDITHQLAAQAELVAARADREVMAERERIARDLHDMVIQRVFGAGLALQSITARLTRPDTPSRIHTVIDELDATIRELRGTIFNLNQPAQRAASLRAQVLDETTAAQDRLGFAPAVEFHGPVDAALPDETAAHLLAALREALSNVARHARASTVRVAVRAGDELLLEVVDDGCGVDPSVTRSSGLTNLRRRAEKLGGTLELTGGREGGTRLCWCIPLAAEDPTASPGAARR